MMVRKFRIFMIKPFWKHLLIIIGCCITYSVTDYDYDIYALNSDININIQYIGRNLSITYSYRYRDRYNQSQLTSCQVILLEKSYNQVSSIKYLI